MKMNIHAVIVAGLITVTTLTANATSVSTPPASEPHMPTIEHLDAITMESQRGGFAPLALALGIASFDLALMGVYWGIYLPYYAPQGPSFNTNLP